MTADPWPYSLEALCNETVRCLEHYGLRDSASDQRVSAAPDGRTVRYYTSLGLLDRPQIEGRQARYSARHLVQLLAVKALQSQDLALADIQKRLYGRSEPELLAIIEAAAISRTPTQPAFTPVVWREITIEPGLKIMVEDGWTPSDDSTHLEARVRAALAALRERSPHAHPRQNP